MNSTSLTLSAEDHKSLAVLLAVLPDAGAQASLPDCKDYQTYRPILQAALPLIQKIPIIGSKIATALSFLMALADGVCNVSPPQVTPGSDTIKIEKSGENELRVTLPQGAKINSDNISEEDLYLALSRHLLTSPRSAGGVGICLLDGTCALKF